MIELLVSLLVLLLIVIVVRYIVDELGLPPKVKMVVWLILSLIFLLVLLHYLGIVPLSLPRRV